MHRRHIWQLWFALWALHKKFPKLHKFTNIAWQCYHSYRPTYRRSFTDGLWWDDASRPSPVADMHRQQSVTTVKSLLMCRLIMSMRVAASCLFSGHSARNTSLVSRQIPPITHWPSTKRPLLYFLLPNLLSSTSTVNPEPPVSFFVSFAMVSKHTSVQQLPITAHF